VSLVLLRFLADQSADLQAVTMFRWLSRVLDLSAEHELRGRILALNEILGLEWATIEKFYAERAKEEG
jgi:hypothetical protein